MQSYAVSLEGTKERTGWADSTAWSHSWRIPDPASAGRPPRASPQRARPSIAADLKPDTAQETAKQIESDGGTASALEMDVTDAANVAAGVEAIVAIQGRASTWW